MKLRFTIPIALVVAMTTPLVACASPSPAPSPSTTAAVETPSPSPTAEPKAALITFTAETVVITTDNGETLATFNYFQPTAEIVPALTEVFGFEPTVERTVPYEGWPSTWIEWEGFRIQDTEQESDGVYYVDYRISAETAAVRGIAIQTVDGISVGDDPLPIQAANQEWTQHFTPPNIGHEIFSIAIGRVPLPEHDFGDGQGPVVTTFTVGLDGSVGSAVERIFAPMGGGPGI
jgi:hypothetical protein